MDFAETLRLDRKAVDILEVGLLCPMENGLKTSVSNSATWKERDPVHGLWGADAGPDGSLAAGFECRTDSFCDALLCLLAMILCQRIFAGWFWELFDNQTADDGTGSRHSHRVAICWSCDPIVTLRNQWIPIECKAKSITISVYVKFIRSNSLNIGHEPWRADRK